MTKQEEVPNKFVLSLIPGNDWDWSKMKASKEEAIQSALEDAEQRSLGSHIYYIGLAVPYDAHERYVDYLDAHWIHETLATACSYTVEDTDHYPDIKNEHLEAAAKQVQEIVLKTLKEHATPATLYEVNGCWGAINVIVTREAPPSWSPRLTIPMDEPKPCSFRVGDQVRVIATDDELHAFFQWEDDENCYEPGMVFTIAEIEEDMISPHIDHPAPIGHELLELVVETKS